MFSDGLGLLEDSLAVSSGDLDMESSFLSQNVADFSDETEEITSVFLGDDGRIGGEPADGIGAYSIAD